MSGAFPLLAIKKNKIPRYIPPLPPLHLSCEMRKQGRAFQESAWTDWEEVGVTGATGLSWLSPFQVLPHISLLCARDVSLLFAPFRTRANVFACSHKHFDYLSGSTSSGEIIMGFHELLHVDHDFELIICNNRVQDFAVSATGFEQEPFLVRAYRSI